MSVRHALLGLLARGPRHGYELKLALESELFPGTHLNIGQVYTTLDRLERDGLVTHERVAQTERPDRKVFSLTPAGDRELSAWLERPAPLDLDLRNATFLKLVLARALPGADARRVIALERQSAFARLHDVQRSRAAAGATPDSGLLLELASLRLEAFLKWLDHCEESLGK
ncbi:MAG: PadR family transcriptional regulator [Planctomycetota bacterium]